jgi:hypothetical protein
MKSTLFFYALPLALIVGAVLFHLQDKHFIAWFWFVAGLFSWIGAYGLISNSSDHEK